MSETILIRNARLVNEGRIFEGDLLIKDQRIALIATQIDRHADRQIDANGMILMPGVIDDQVHFREPGMEYKATIYTESRAAVAGGVTSYMDMPNTRPPSLTRELLEQRYRQADLHSAANYSFYMGASNDNLNEVLRTDSENVCGIKIFMGSSTGNMLVDEPSVLEGIFANSPMLIATHCEDESTVRKNHEIFSNKYGSGLNARHHPAIRSEEACFLSSSHAVGLAKKHGTRLHVLHLTTEKEMSLFNNDLPLAKKMITAEVCVHHLFFNDLDYDRMGNRLKCNPAVKTSGDQTALMKALLEDRLDVVATDHAPHTLDEKERPYTEAPSGLPLVQHSLPAMLEFYHDGMISLERIVEKMCHAPAVAFRIRERGFLREGYFADLVMLDLENNWAVNSSNILYKCGWSPFENFRFRSRVLHTWVNGRMAYSKGKIIEGPSGKRLTFELH